MKKHHDQKAAVKLSKEVRNDLKNADASKVSGMPAKHIQVINEQFQSIASVLDLERQRAVFVILNRNFIPRLFNMKKMSSD